MDRPRRFFGRFRKQGIRERVSPEGLIAIVVGREVILRKPSGYGFEPPPPILKPEVQLVGKGESSAGSPDGHPLLFPALRRSQIDLEVTANLFPGLKQLALAHGTVMLSRESARP